MARVVETSITYYRAKNAMVGYAWTKMPGAPVIYYEDESVGDITEPLPLKEEEIHDEKKTWVDFLKRR